ncbi:MAG: hypothetical protein K2M16_06885, partial [Muribaculaceae bacterium]|nr:hypothetical protein [Muribaculaceae bacterium]
LSNMLRATCLVVWLIALVFSAASITKIVSNVNINHFRKHHVSRERTEMENISEKKEKQAAQLYEAGWTIVKENNIRNFTNKGQHYSGNKNLSYLDAAVQNDGLGMEYEVERTQKVAPGTYRLEAKGRANGNGAEIYAVDGRGVRSTAAIPVCDYLGGSVWKNACLELESDTAKMLPNRHYLEKLSKVNGSHGYGWSDIVINDIIVGPDSLIRYGVTNLSDIKTWDGTWLSATSFELIRQDKK